MVKIFSGKNIEVLEEKINTWIAENSGKLSFGDISMTSREDGQLYIVHKYEELDYN